MATQALEVDISVKNLLLATDFEESARTAFLFAAAIAKQYGATLHTVHVIDPQAMQTADSPENWENDLITSKDFAETRMRKLAELAVDFAIRHEETVESGPIAETIAKLVADKRVDLVIAGTRGSSGLAKMLFGSGAEGIFRQVKCPVLTIGPGILLPAEREIPVALNEILFPTDFSPQSLNALPYAVSLAKVNRAHLTVLYVHDDELKISYADQAVLKREYSGELARLLPAEIGLWVEPAVQVVFGKPSETILQVADDTRANLIVLGVRYAKEFANHLPWSIASKILRGAHCPVLTVRYRG